MSEPIVNSSGNVFIDLGFPPDESAVLQMRADLLADLRTYMKSRKLSPAAAARALKLSQARTADLIDGKWDRFSLEMLISLATRAGMHVALQRAA